jgi:hypothetical protein
MQRHLKSRAAPRLALLLTLCLHAAAQAAQVGWRQIQVPGGPREPATTVVALYYPTAAATRTVAMGPFTVTAAMQAAPDAPLPWKLMGVHSARLDMAGRDLVQDESLGLNCAWYANMLMTLSEA